MFSTDEALVLLSTTSIGYILLYAVVNFHVEEVTTKSVPFFSVVRVLREGIGMAVRFAYDLPTYYCITDELKALGLTRGDVTEALVRESFERVRKDMRRSPWAYPPSQRKALAHLVTNARVLAKCISLCRSGNAQYDLHEVAGLQT